MNTNRIVLSYSNLESQQKLIDYVYLKTGKLINPGDIGYDGKLSILVLDLDLSNYHKTNITCAPYAGKYHFRSVDDFINWYELNGKDLINTNINQ